ncbi:PBECR4 domain-containing protein [Streptococcus oralis]|uniref:PBECR4 domain-containing protein n=1 Tax=Streptococcus oralis TaxID=1303 RepID=UPI001C1F19F7|nr:PBECR4 domain-containing protein [Streptococcus oralis]MBU6873425.1 toprim domain-containing protein [Streptococcus oralis]
MTEQESRRGKSRRERVEFARSRDILDVANELHMELVRSGRDYRWKEHDSLVISPDKNLWKWFSRNTGGDAISLVETIKEIDFNQSVDFLNDGNFKEFQMVERAQEDFKYYLEKYEQPFSDGRDYLRDQRGLSDETIDYFLEQGVLAQANAKLDYFAEGAAGVTTNAIEPVIVFKSLSSSGEVVGASLQGIQENWEKWPKHGYAKVIMKNSDPMTGIHVDIGSPKRLIFTESPIDLMSYYELHKDSLQDVRLVSMDGLKESTIGRHLSQIQAEISGKLIRWTPEQMADGLQVAIDHHFFEDGKNADLITLALDNDKAGRTFIQELEAKGAVINSDLPELRPGQDKTDWNDVLKNQQEEKSDNSRLAQARRKLERLKGEQDEAISRAYSHQALTNGQPINDKRGGANFMRKQEQIEGRVFSKMDEIKQQEERVERLEHQQHLKEMGLNRQGSGLEMSVQNIPRIREELEKAKRGESFFTKATLKRYQEELTRLEAISEQMGKTIIQPATQALIDDGSVNQWAKQPNLYFVKGLRRVAVELTEEGTFVPSTKYRPRTDEEKSVLDNLLDRQNDVELPGVPSVEPEQKEESILGHTEGEQGVLFENLADVTPSSDHAMEPELQVVFDFSENPKLSKQYSSGEVIPYNDFIAKLYEENDWQLIIPDSGYDKTYFALQDESGNSLISSIRYDIGSEREDLSEQLNQDLPAPYLELAQKADHDYRAQVSYDTFKANQERLSEAVQSQIQAGALRITLSDEAYFYTLVNYTGWSHPMQQLKPKALENLKEYRTFFESINDTNIDRFKEKGTPEQNQMYDILKSIQKELGRSNTSTVFSEEVAISAYNLNRQLDSLTAENWGKSIVDPLGALGRDTWNIISYPANEIVTGNVDYYYQLVPYHLLDYLNGKTGTVEISPETYDHILQQLRNEEVIITPEAAEEVDVSSEHTIFSDEETEKPLEVHQGQDVSEQQKNERMYQRKGYLQPEAEGSTSPVLETSTFERSVTSRPTVSSQYLNFSIKDGFKSRKTKYEKSIDAYNLGKLNRRGVDIQEAAQFYLNELANSTVHYFTSDGSLVQVNFLEENFLHLTGLKIIGDAATPEKVLHDFANGGELSYDDIRLKNTESPFDKIKVLPDLETVLQTDSFYFDDLQDIPRYQGRFDSLIKSDDSDLMLLFRTNTEDGIVPVSVFKARQVLKVELQEARKNEILGIFRERGGLIEQIDINKNYVKDDGEEMLSILKNKQYEESRDIDDRSMNVSSDQNVISEITEQEFSPEKALPTDTFSAELFTKVLDSAYNVGDPRKLGLQVPEESKGAWERYYELSDSHEGNFSAVVDAADQLGFVDKNSNFYQEWNQDRIFSETYHVRLQWSETWPDGPQIPFKETELVDYQIFAETLYKENKAFYERRHGSVAEVNATGNQEAYIPFTKVKFDVYAPGGEVIKEGIRYDVGDETKPISQMLGLGYRRLNGQSVLASMDEEILSQLENREVNKEISQEANESARLTGEGEGQTPDTRETVAFQSSKQETKTNLLQRVEEILKEEPISDLETPEVNSSSIDYASLTPHELSEVAFQKVREYTETPERLEEYLNFMSKFPELSPRNVALIHEQWPGANAVATYNQWQSMGEVLGITSDQVFETRNTYTNKKTGRTREVVHNNLSVKTGEKSHITLFRPMMVEMIPVLDENGNQVKNGKGNPKYKRLSEATPEEKALKKEGKLKSRFFQERDSNTGLAKFATYKVFELSQTTLKPEFYPKAMPNRHYDFNMDHIRTKEVLEGLSDYAKNIGVTIYQDDAKELRSAKGSFYPDEQKILLNPDNTPGEVIATTIHELAHASLHNPKFANSYKEDVSKDRRELEAEMTSYLVSKHFGLDTSEKAIRYMAIWTDNLTSLDDQQLAQSMKRIHGTVSKIVKSVEQHTKPYQLNRQVVQNQNFIQSPKKGLKV